MCKYIKKGLILIYRPIAFLEKSPLYVTVLIFLLISLLKVYYLKRQIKNASKHFSSVQKNNTDKKVFADNQGTVFDYKKKSYIKMTRKNYYHNLAEIKKKVLDRIGGWKFTEKQLISLILEKVSQAKPINKQNHHFLKQALQYFENRIC